MHGLQFARIWPKNGSSGSVRWGRCWKKKWETVFLKYYITGYIEAISRHMKAFVTSMVKTVTKKNILKRTRLKFIGVIGTKIRPTRTAKNFEKRVIRWSFK